MKTILFIHSGAGRSAIEDPNMTRIEKGDLFTMSLDNGATVFNYVVERVDYVIGKKHPLYENLGATQRVYLEKIDEILARRRREMG